MKIKKIIRHTFCDDVMFIMVLEVSLWPVQGQLKIHFSFAIKMPVFLCPRERALSLRDILFLFRNDALRRAKVKKKGKAIPVTDHRGP
jgi:hypothetical protein